MAKIEKKVYRHNSQSYSIEVKKNEGDYITIDTKNGPTKIAPGDYVATVVKDESTTNNQELGDVFCITEFDLNNSYSIVE